MRGRSLCNFSFSLLGWTAFKRVFFLSFILCQFASWAVSEPLEPRRLNNFVVEYADVKFAEDDRSFSLELCSPEWLYISLSFEGRAAVILTGGDGTVTALEGPGETMRYLPAGDVSIRVLSEGASRPRRLIVRRIPEIFVYRYERQGGPTKFTDRWLEHSWTDLEETILHSTNLVASLNLEAYIPFAEKWQNKGRRWITSHYMGDDDQIRSIGVDPAEYWSKWLCGYDWDGVIHDELIDYDFQSYGRFAAGLSRFSLKPSASGKTVYFWSDASEYNRLDFLDYFFHDAQTSVYGSKSMRCEAQRGGVKTARQFLWLEPDEDYTISAYIKTENSVPGEHSGIFLVDRGWHKKFGVLSAPEGTDGWTRYKTTFNTGPLINRYRPFFKEGENIFEIIIVGPESGIFWIDAVQLERGNEATPFSIDLPNIVSNPMFGKNLVPWDHNAVWNLLRDALIEYDHVIVPELYMNEQPTEEQAREIIEERLVRKTSQYLGTAAGFPSQVLIGLSSADCGTIGYSNDHYPHVNYHTLVDMQIHALATGEGLEGLRGVGIFCTHYANFETLRLFGSLFRHYCIEGNTVRFSAHPYKLDHLTNPGFEQGLDGWTIEGTVESVAVEDMPGGGKRGIYSPIPEGKKVIRTVRENVSRVNSFSQTVRNLEAGKLYSLKLYCADPDYSKRLIPARIDIRDAQFIPEKSWSHVWSRHGVSWTTHYKIFRAGGTEARLRISDEIGGEIYWDFIQIQPYFEG